MTDRLIRQSQRLTFGLLAAAAATLYVPPTFGAEAKAVPVEARVAVCAACHGENGVSPSPQFPNLAGQHEDYLYYTLKAYKNGERTNAIMKGQVIELSDEDFRNLAKWYADQEAVLYTPSRSNW